MVRRFSYSRRLPMDISPPSSPALSLTLTLPPGLVPLPIDELLPHIVEKLASGPNLVIAAPPGAGKTTRVPQALLSLFPEGEIVVLEPRRIAAHLSALRVAEERGEPLGDTVGVQLRFESVISRKTRLRFVTEGVLLRQLAADPQLSKVKAVIFDEFHERHYQTDLLLALLRRLQLGERPELRLCVMSSDRRESGPKSRGSDRALVTSQRRAARETSPPRRS